MDKEKDREMIRRMNEAYAESAKDKPDYYFIPVDNSWWRANKEQAEKLGISVVTTCH